MKIKIVIWGARVTIVAAGADLVAALAVGLARWEQVVALAALMGWSALVSYYAARAGAAWSPGGRRTS